jgi:hypothetical protein
MLDLAPVRDLPYVHSHDPPTPSLVVKLVALGVGALAGIDVAGLLDAVLILELSWYLGTGRSRLLKVRG